MNVMVLASKEHLRRGYKAVLELKGCKVVCDNPECVVIDVGADLSKEASNFAKNTPLNVAVFIVSASLTGEIPQIANKTVVLNSPITAEMLLRILEDNKNQ